MSTQSVIDALGDSHDKLVEVRSVLERADSALAVADEVVVRAEEIIEKGRRSLPIVLAAVGVLAIVGTGVYVWRKRAQASAEG
jgi:hypothetical protein